MAENNEEPIASVEGMKGAFGEALVRNNKKIRQDRALAIAESAQMIYKRTVEDLQLSIKQMRRDRDAIIRFTEHTSAATFFIDLVYFEDIERTRKTELIFEGAQGILLDQVHGFFPNVTRSNTTIKNVLTMCEPKEVYYVTRSYMTRHGNGPVPEAAYVEIKNNANESNKTNDFQGRFRSFKLNLPLLRYAAECERLPARTRTNLVVTCCDQVKADFGEIVDGIGYEPDRLLRSDGPAARHVKQVNQ